MRRWLLAFLKVREMPEPPPGSGPELLKFRASRRFLHYGAVALVARQVGAFLGLLFYLDFTGFLDIPFLELTATEYMPERMGRWVEELEAKYFPFPRVVYLLEVGAIIVFAFQLITRFLLLKLSWELRWYMVGNKSLRIREGLWRLQEQTITIANIQNMTIRQGPLQKLFGIEDLEIHTAGGGDESKNDGSDKDKIHPCRFRGLEDASALRDRIRGQLARYRGAGLGEAEVPRETPSFSAAATSPGRIAAAEDLLAEVRSLRKLLT